MKKTSILDFFKMQTTCPKVSCPACGILLSEFQINKHLDSSCMCSVSSTKTSLDYKKEGTSKKSSFHSKRQSSVSSNKLSLKNNKKIKKSKHAISSPNIAVTNYSDDDVVIIEDVPRVSENLKSSAAENNCFRTNPSNMYTEESLPSETCESNGFLEGISRKSMKRKSSLKNNKTLGEVSISKPNKYSKYKNMAEVKIIPSSKTPCNNPISVKEIPAGEKLNSISNEVINIKLQISNQFNENLPNESDNESCSLYLNKKINSAENSSSDILNSRKDHSELTDNARNEISNSELKLNSNISDNVSSEIADILNVAKDHFGSDNVFSELSDNNEKATSSYEPYYIANFKHILKTVLTETENKILFNKEDRKSISNFESLSDSEQKLYVRLFQRKYKWLRASKIKYPEITTNPVSTLDKLVSAQLVDSGTDSIHLEMALDLISLPEAKTLAKHFKLVNGKSKSDIKQMLLKHCKEHKSVFFTGRESGISSVMLKKIQHMVGKCYRISVLPRRVFTRVLMLFSLPTLSEDDDDAAGGQQQQLLTLLQVNKGELIFPEYKQTKRIQIFCDREELISYEEAKQLENDILNLMENKNYVSAKELCESAKKTFEDMSSSKIAKRAASLPVFLRRYSCMHVYVRCMTQAVDACQRLRQYKEAVSLLRTLLQLKVFCVDYHGFWYDRLALNLEQHLKKPEQALEAIKAAVMDRHVRVGYRHSLLSRALRITKTLEDPFRTFLLEEEAKVQEAPKVFIKGNLCPRPILGRKHVFVSSYSVTSEDDVTVLGVEQLALEHYQQEGFPDGVHGEGSTFISLYCLLFWDLVYDGDIPDAFISPHQTHPLDLNYDTFFTNREEGITEHLDTLRQSTKQELKDIIESTWSKHHGKASLVAWDRFADAKQVQGLVGCLGIGVVCGVCERLAKDFRFTRSGVPDLVVWNTESGRAKVVEVKGPGDKLSSKQVLWLDALIKMGAEVEVCHIEAVGSKRLRK